MKLALAVVVLLVVVWLGLWVSNTGLLVSSSDTGVLKTRDCHYFIGVSVVERLEQIADRCPLVRKVGG